MNFLEDNNLIMMSIALCMYTNASLFDYIFIISFNEFFADKENYYQYKEDNNKQLPRKNKEEWIEKDFKNQVKRIDKNSIFLPRQNELTFRVLS